MEAGANNSPYTPQGAGKTGTPTGLERFANGFVDPVRNILVEAGHQACSA